MVVSGHQLNYMNYYGAMITESLLLRYDGKNQYQQGYRSQSCDVFTVIERGSKEYNDYVSKINGISDIEKNPYAYSDILKNFFLIKFENIVMKLVLFPHVQKVKNL